MVVSRKQSTPDFPKKQIFLTLWYHTRTYGFQMILGGIEVNLLKFAQYYKFGDDS